MTTPSDFDDEATSVEATEEGRYRISWALRSGGPEAGSVRVFVGAAPDAIDHRTPIAESDDGKVVVEVQEIRRPYFALQRGEGRPHVVATRQVPLDGITNFRDIGGYVTSGESGPARRVRWGLVYRSGHFHGASDEDHETLAALGLANVFDFRTPQERDSRPSSFGARPPARVLELSIDPGSGIGMWQNLDGRDFSADSMRASMQEINREMVRDHADAYREMFETLVEDAGKPAVIHCASGKDRTGVGTALLLMVLGVARETILHDYLLTNRYLERGPDFLHALKDIGGFDPDIFDAKAIEVMFDAREEYLGAALAEIDEGQGGVDAYFHDRLGLTDASIAELRARYLD